MPTARTGLGAAIAVLALSACGSAPTAGPTPTTSTSYASPSPSEQTAGDEQLSPANLASELLGRLAAKGTFRVVSRTTVDGRDATEVTADVRLTGEAGLIASGGGRKVIKTSKALYLKDADVTGSRSRPWSELADGGGGAAARSADRLVRAAQVHAVIGAAAHASTFQRGDRITVNGVPAQEYVVTVDVARAVEADALGGYLTADDPDSLPKALTLRIAVAAECLPVQLRFTLDRRTDVVAVFSRFAQKLTVTAPSADRVATSPAN